MTEELTLIGEWTPREDNAPLGMPFVVEGQRIGQVVGVEYGKDEDGCVSMTLTIESRR